MRFDLDDIGNHFRNTVRHEMGHVSFIESLFHTNDSNIILAGFRIRQFVGGAKANFDYQQ